MSSIQTVAPPPTGAAAGQRPRWSVAQYLALLGVLILIYEIVSIVNWLIAGPTAAPWGAHNADWWAARIIEGLTILLSLIVLRLVVRDARAQRRLLTFDVMWCLCGATLFWADVGCNIFLPEVVVSSNWVNLHGICGHMPGVPNPDCGRVPDPMLWEGLTEAFVALGWAKSMGVVIDRIQRRRSKPLSHAKQVLLLCIAGMTTVLLEPFVIIPLHLWAWPGMPLSIFGGTNAYPVVELFAFGLAFGALGALYLLRDDRGHRVVERGLERYSPTRRKLVTMLALYASMQVLGWGFGDGLLWLPGFFQHRWHAEPRYVLNDTCDAPGVHGTRYGPCPGSPGFRMPLQGTGLPGTSP